MAQLVNGRSLTAEARFQSQSNPSLISGEKLTLREGFQRVYAIIPPTLCNWQCLQTTHKSVQSNAEWKQMFQYPTYKDTRRFIFETCISILAARGLVSRLPLRSVFVW